MSVRSAALGALAVVLVVPAVLASYCGKSGVPYSFEVLPSGAPVLGCAQPSCVAVPEDFEEDSEFLTDANGQADGFFREGDRALKRFRHDSAPKLFANCSGGFSQLSCPRKNQWVGGIEYIDHPRQPLILQCCSFDGLRFSQEVGITVVGPGEAITGGEVVRNGRQISFDVIANVRKIVQPGHGHKPSYEVTVRRMKCLPDPPEPEVEFDKEVPSEVLKVLSTAKNGKDLGAREKLEKAKKEKSEQPPTQFAAKQFAAENENSINVDPSPVNQPGQANLEPLSAPAAPQPPVSPPQLPLPSAAAAVDSSQPAVFAAPQQVQPVAPPGFGGPALPGFPDPSSAFSLHTLPPYDPAATSTWDQAVSDQPPRPTYPNGAEVFPTIGTSWMTPMTLAPIAGLPGFPVVTPAPLTVPGVGGVPEQVHLPSLAHAPPLPVVEQQVQQGGSAGAIATIDQSTGGAQAQAAPNVAVGQALATGGAQPQPQTPTQSQTPTQTQQQQFQQQPQQQQQQTFVQSQQQQFQTPTQQQPQPQQPQQPTGFAQPQFQPPAFQMPALPGFQPFTFPPLPPHPAFPTPPTPPPSAPAFPTFPPHPAFPTMAPLPNQAPDPQNHFLYGSPRLSPLSLNGTLAPMPAFSFPTLPPVPATTPHPLFTLPPAPTFAVPQPLPQVSGGLSQPAQAQGTLLFPGLAPIQFPGLGPLSATGTRTKKN